MKTIAYCSQNFMCVAVCVCVCVLYVSIIIKTCNEIPLTDTLSKQL